MKREQSMNPASAVLWASAFIVAAMIVLQAGRLPGNPAYAEMTSNRTDYELMTTSGGTGGDADPNELLYIIDSRDQVLLVYEIENLGQRQILLRDGGSLDNLFRGARR